MKGGGRTSVEIGVEERACVYSGILTRFKCKL